MKHLPLIRRVVYSAKFRVFGLKVRSFGCKFVHSAGNLKLNTLSYSKNNPLNTPSCIRQVHVFGLKFAYSSKCYTLLARKRGCCIVYSAKKFAYAECTEQIARNTLFSEALGAVLPWPYRPGRIALAVSPRAYRPGCITLAVLPWPYRPGRIALAASSGPYRPGRIALAVSPWPYRPGRIALALPPWPYCPWTYRPGRIALAVSPWPYRRGRIAIAASPRRCLDLVAPI